MEDLRPFNPGLHYPLSHNRLPPELWLAVFKSDDLSPEDVKNVTLTQQSFRWLAQPLLFSYVNITTRVKWGSIGENPKAFQTSEYIDQVHSRLAFIILERIAPSVEVISISGAYTANADGLILCENLFDTLFESLHHFKNLNTFGGDSIVLTTPMVTALYTHHHLQRLRLYWCSISPTFTALDLVPKCQLTEFTHSEDYTGSEGSSPWWIPLLSREATQSLLVTEHGQARSVMRFLAQGTPMKALETLEISTLAVNAVDFLPALQNCPSLTHLSFHDPPPPLSALHNTTTIDRLLSSGSNLKLDHVRVPPDFATQFVRARPLRRLDIFSFMSSDFAETLIHEVREYRPKMAQLVLSLQSFAMSSFISILAFPSMEWISLFLRETLCDEEVEQV